MNMAIAAAVAWPKVVMAPSRSCRENMKTYGDPHVFSSIWLSVAVPNQNIKLAIATRVAVEVLQRTPDQERWEGFSGENTDRGSDVEKNIAMIKKNRMPPKSFAVKIALVSLSLFLTSSYALRIWSRTLLPSCKRRSGFRK